MNKRANHCPKCAEFREAVRARWDSTPLAIREVLQGNLDKHLAEHERELEESAPMGVLGGV